IRAADVGARPRSAAGNPQLAAEVEPGALVEHERLHGLAALRLDLRESVAVAGFRRVPNGDADDLVPINRIALVCANHAVRELARSPAPAELLARTGLQPACRDPHVRLFQV